MRKDGKKTSKAKRAKKAVVKNLAVRDAKAVKGGLTVRKAGKDQLEY